MEPATRDFPFRSINDAGGDVSVHYAIVMRPDDEDDFHVKRMALALDDGEVTGFH